MKFSAIITRALAAAALLGTASTATAAICDEFPGPTTAQRAVFPSAGNSSAGSLDCGNAKALSGASFLNNQKRIQVRVTSRILPVEPLARVFGFENATVPNASCQASDDEDQDQGGSANCPSFVTRWRSELDITVP